MKNKANETISLRAGLRVSVVALLAMAAAAGCTKKKELTSKVDSEFYIAKSEFVGKTFHLVRGVEDADENNDIGAIPGFSDDSGLVQARITENELQFISVYGTTNRNETSEIVASFPITAQFDIKREENDYKEQTNKIVENTERPWNQRQYIRVNWGSPSNSKSKFGTMLGDSKLQEENVTLIETPSIQPGHISWLVESNFKGNDSFTPIFPFNFLGGGGFLVEDSARVTYRTHLLEVKTSDFKPVPYSTKDFERFGYFTTQQNIEDPEKGFRDGNIKVYARTFNVCEAGRPESCSKNQIVWVLSKNFPQRYLETTRQVVKEWNETFQQALNRKDNVVVLDESVQADISDPTKNIIAHFDPKASGGLLGVAQSVEDPRTGELRSVRATVYEVGIRHELAGVDTTLDLIEQDPAVRDVLTGGSNKTGLEQKAAAREILSQAKIGHKVFGLSKIKRPSGGLTLKAAAFDAKKKIAAPVEKATARKQALMVKAPELFTAEEFNVFSAFDVAGMKFQFNFPSLKNEATKEEQRAFDVLRGLSRMARAGETRRAERTLTAKQAEQGIHGSEIVEEAVIRYIAKMVKKYPNPTDLKANRAKIKEEIAQLTFYTTLLHEMGHTFGLRHNFEGSADKKHFHEKYTELSKKLAKGDKDVTPEDLEPYAYSSVMDYPSDFYIQAGGLGPYDKAAIKYAYNRSINREADAVTLAGYKFCTDHQVGESILCRRFDKGTNVSEITMHEIDRFERNWVLSHSRRDRATFETSAQNYPGRAFGTMVNIRQVMDEMLYALITSPSVAAGENQCDSKFMRVSVDAKEIANICDVIEMEQNGIDPSDFSTYANGLLDPNTGDLRVKPADYVPGGFADLAYANVIALKFFRDVIGAPEPGTFLALPPQEQGMPFVLERLAEGGSDEDKLKAFATERGVKDMDRFVQQAKQFVTQVSFGRYGRPLMSTSTSEAGIDKLQTMGSFMDKYVAFFVLGLRDIGISKYSNISLTGNAFAYPQTKLDTTVLFNQVVTENPSITMIPVKLRSGNQVLAVAPAALNRDTQAIATITALTDFVLDSDQSIVDKMRVCSLDEQGCRADAGGQVVEFVSSSGQNKFRAAQSRIGDSIAFSLVSAAAEKDKERQKWLEKVLKAGDLQADSIMKLTEAKELRDQIDANLAKFPNLAQLRAQIISEDPKVASAWNYLNLLASQVAENSNAQKFTIQTVASQVIQAFTAGAQVVDKELATLEKKQCAVTQSSGANNNARGASGAGDASAEQAQADCEARLAALKSLKGDFEKIVNVAGEVLQTTVELAFAPKQVERLESDIQTLESNMVFIRKIMDMTGVK